MVDYTRYDYNALVQRASELLKSKDGWGNGYDSSTGQELIQLLADTADQLHYMLERRSQEMYIDTARLESSIIARASEFGYRARRALGARGTLLLELIDQNGAAINPQGTVVIPEESSVFYNDIEFITLNRVEISPTQTTAEIDVVQGTLETFTFDPTDPNSDISRFGFGVIEDYRYLDNNFLRVFEGSNEYVDVINGSDDLAAIGAVSFAAEGERYYDIRYPATGMRVIFGDSISGVVPTSNVTVTGISTLATQVEIVNTLDFRFNTDKLTDDVVVVPANEYDYRLTNTTNIANAAEPEDVESIRLNSTSYIRTNNRAVSREDFRFWVLQAGIGGIIDAEVFGEQEINTLLYNANNVYISYLTNDGLPMTVPEIQDLREYMRRLAGVTIHLIFNPVNIINIGYEIAFRRHPALQISDSELHDVIRRKMAELLELKNGSIGMEVQKSDIVDAFYRATIVRNNITYELVDFIDIKLNGYFKIESPFSTNIATVSIPTGAGIVDGEIFTVIVDGTSYSVTAASDTATTIIGKMRDKIFQGTGFNVTLNGSEMTIRSFERNRVFSVDVSMGDLSDRAVVDYEVQIPPRTFDNPNSNNLFVPGSMAIVDDEGTVFYTDNGSGQLIDAIGSNQPGTINYVDGSISLPVLSPGEYFVRFKQDGYDNIIANTETAVDVIDARTDYLNQADLRLSTIALV